MSSSLFSMFCQRTEDLDYLLKRTKEMRGKGSSSSSSFSSFSSSSSSSSSDVEKAKWDKKLEERKKELREEMDTLRQRLALLEGEYFYHFSHSAAEDYAARQKKTESDEEDEHEGRYGTLTEIEKAMEIREARNKRRRVQGEKKKTGAKSVLEEIKELHEKKEEKIQDAKEGFLFVVDAMKQDMVKKKKKMKTDLKLAAKLKKLLEDVEKENIFPVVALAKGKWVDYVRKALPDFFVERTKKKDDKEEAEGGEESEV